ncbi:uncharacterized protein BJ171DRAFT_518567 [Polychytrium aggregatum]|uniref:uncharacterized protein n=1 Tax=Polychytrium aggregatum TaxID=110093 RepID=UPI0022FE5175|nr:uncharacterized protein BJ171DRAFT_518567 [Polychytrium aggregatum]KAI9199500.1 hypothetical protein BJ171DRAFT_518567 [Polychytrium aggregatum]
MGFTKLLQWTQATVAPLASSLRVKRKASKKNLNPDSGLGSCHHSSTPSLVSDSISERSVMTNNNASTSTLCLPNESLDPVHIDPLIVGRDSHTGSDDSYSENASKICDILLSESIEETEPSQSLSRSSSIETFIRIVDPGINLITSWSSPDHANASNLHITDKLSSVLDTSEQNAVDDSSELAKAASAAQPPVRNSSLHRGDLLALSSLSLANISPASVQPSLPFERYPVDQLSTLEVYSLIRLFGISTLKASDPDRPFSQRVSVFALLLSLINLDPNIPAKTHVSEFQHLPAAQSKKSKATHERKEASVLIQTESTGSLDAIPLAARKKWGNGWGEIAEPSI